MSKLSKATIRALFPEGDFWALMIDASSKLQVQRTHVLLLQAFLQIPSNGYLIQTQLEKFLLLKECFTNEADIFEELNAFFDTAKMVLREAEGFMSSYKHVSVEKVIKAISKPETTSKEVEDFIEQKMLSHFSPMNFQTERKLFYFLFYPYVDDSYTRTDELLGNYEAINKLKAYVFNYLAIGFSVEHETRLHDSLYRAITHREKHYFNEHLELDNLYLMSSAEEILETLKSKIGVLNTYLSNTKKLDQLIIEYSNLVFGDSASINQITREEMKEVVQDARETITAFASFFRAMISLSDYDADGRKRGTKREGADRKKRFGFAYLSSAHGLYHQEESVVSNIKNNNTKMQKLYLLRECNLNESDGMTMLIDDEPPCKIKNPAVKVLSGKSKHHHLALSAQFLLVGEPVSSIKTAFTEIIDQLKVALSCSFDDFAKHMKTLLPLLIFLMTGRKVKTINITLDMQKFRRDVVSLQANGREICLPISAYPYKLAAYPEIYVPIHNEVLTLKLPIFMQSLLSKTLSRFIAEGCTEILCNNLEGALSIVYQNKQIDSIEDFIFKSLLKSAQGDLWLSSLIHNQVKSVAQTQMHYASCKPSTIQRVFNSHLKTLSGSTSRITEQLHDYRIGSKFYIQEERVGQLIRLIRVLIRINQRHFNRNILFAPDMVHIFNLLNFYTDFILSFVTGTRSVEDPYIKPENINIHCWTVVNDKNMYDGYNTRWVYVPEEVRFHLTEFEKIRREFLLRLTSRKQMKGVFNARPKNKPKHEYEGFAKEHDLFLFRTMSIAGSSDSFRFTPTPYQRTTAILFAEKAFKHFKVKSPFPLAALKTNSNRHYLRGKLLDSEVDPYYIDCYLGHWHIGTEPWGKHSIFNIENYQLQLSKAIDSIVTDLKLKSISFIEGKRRNKSSLAFQDERHE
jgi:hypothetical protein